MSSLAFCREKLEGPQFRTRQTLKVGQVFSALPSSPLPFPRCPQEGPAILLHLRDRRSTLQGPFPRFQIFATTLNVHLRVFASRMLCLLRYVQCHAFSCSLGRCGRHGMRVAAGNSLAAGTTGKFAPIVDFWNRCQLELEHSCVAEFHAEFALMMAMQVCCRLKGLICRLSALASPATRCIWYQVPGYS